MSKHNFVKRLLAGSKFDVINGVGLRKLENGNTIKCSIYQGRVRGDYVGLKVNITSADKGEIDVQTFKFDDLLTIDPTSRKDHRTFQVIESCGWEWYIRTPTQASVKSMVNSIEKYVSYFE